MYSGSNSFLGGQSGRPGAPQYGNSFQQQQQQQPPQGGQFNPQATGYGAAPLQANYTGYPIQTQATGYPSNQFHPQQGFQQNSSQFNNAQLPQQQSYTTSPPPMPQIPPQFQPQAQSIPAAAQAAQPTGFSQMADSFRAAPTQQSTTRGRRLSKAKAGVKIPNIRLSFITAQDQAKFETLFKSAVGDSQTLSGEKSRDLLMRSKLDGNSLGQIWTLADTTRSGQLHFPEFALAMYLCNLKLVGKPIPAVLPENIKNEVCSMVDIINFGVGDETPEPPPKTNAPDFSARINTATPPTIQQPQPIQSNSALLTAQMTGFPGQQNNLSGGTVQGQQASFLQTMPTGYNTNQQQVPANTSAAGYNGPYPPMPPMPTGYNQGLSPAQTGFGSMSVPLNSQPTGRPGQWGLVNAPATGLPNIDLLQSRMMPQQGREQGSFTTTGLSGNAVIPWAVTKDEKSRYDSVFKAWDGFNKGFIGGDVAIEVFGQSGLEKPDLERVWTLADHGNKGRLNMDEFSVAMHLIYRKLNGYPLPAQLPPELIPPSTRNFNDSIGAVKTLLHEESDFRKNSGANLLPQKTGVSYLKNHSFRGDSTPSRTGRKDATVFKNDDDDVGYKSSARRRLGGANSPRPSSPSSTTSNDDLSLEQLKKKIREKQVLLDAMDFKDENAAEEDDALDRRDRREAEDLYRRIRRIQEDIDSHPDAALRSIDSGAERRALTRQLQVLTDKLPEIASQVRRTERNIAETRLELFRLKDAKAHPGSASTIVGTGPGGAVTESDRLKARAKAMMQQRSAALTGRKLEAIDDDLAAPKRLEEENLKIRIEKENNERMVKDVEDSVREFSNGLQDSIKEGVEDSSSEHEKRRWEDGLGVEDEVKDFIFDLQRSSRTARVRTEDRGFSSKSRDASRVDPPSRHEPLPVSASAPPTSQSARTASPAASTGSYSQYKTAEDRAAYIKQQAEQRMAERLAALGIKAPTKPGETTQQRVEREKSERAAKLKQAEEEDANREAERQARIAEEQGVPPPAPAISKETPKRPPPPPSRKAAKSDASERQVEEERILIEQKAQILVTNDLKDEARQQEAELAKESEASQARLRALEEQVKAGKVKKEEEKRRKKATQAEAKEKEARLAAQRAEIEAAQARERELQRQLEAIDDDDDDDSSSDESGLEQVTPQASTPTQETHEVDQKETLPSQQETSQPQPQPSINIQTPTTVSPALPTPVLSPPSETETRNPFLKKLAQSGGDIQSATASPSPQSSVSTNPFHRLPAQEAPKSLAEPISIASMPRPSRVRPEEDDWSVVGSDKEDSSDEEGPGAGNARQLASILFGTMGPPRPLSATNTGPGIGSTPDSPSVALDERGSSPTSSRPNIPPLAPHTLDVDAAGGVPPPPPPPPMGMAPPPPPPPPPTSGVPSAMPVGRPAGLLGEIQGGKLLKKTKTVDKSVSGLAGRVLD